MKKVRNILTGWARAFGIIRVPGKVEKMSAERLAICNSCPSAGRSAVLRIINGMARKESQIYCKECKCPCLEKSMVESEKCPLGKWR